MLRTTLSIALLTLVVGCGAKTGLLVPPCPDGGDCCEPGVEICNGLDDDCDGAIDDGIACFTLDGEPIEALETERCGAAWYSYDAPDSQSANPTPDIRIPDGTVVAIQWAPHCPGASVAVITDIPDDGSGGELNAAFTISPPGAAGILVSDEPDRPERPSECTYDRASGEGSCDWTWVNCCTDGMLLGAFTEGCVRMTLTDPVGVAPPVVHDGPDRTNERRYGEPFELCVQIRPAR